VRASIAALGLLLLAIVAAVPAAADWRDEVAVLRVGYVATDDPVAMATRLEPFRAYLSGRIALPVELVPLATYGALIDETSAGRVQYAILSAAAFAALQDTCNCAEPLAVPAAYDGSIGYASILLSRADGPVTSLAAAEGKRLALSGDDSVAGRLVPIHELAGAGVDVNAYFSDVRTVPGPEAAVTAVLSGDADVAAGWSSLNGDASAGYSFGLLTRMVIDGRLTMDQVRVIWRSPLIPFGPHAVRTDLPSELKLLLADALFDMATVAPDVLDAVDRSGYGGGGFVAVDPGAYAVLAGLMRTAPEAPAAP
jgi:phosphonate transport system substrate-binding protein